MRARRPDPAILVGVSPPADPITLEPRLTTTPSEPLQLVVSDARRLTEGAGVRFGVRIDGVAYDAFAVRWHGRVHAYLNVCRHEALPLDFGDARFFDDSYDALVCVQHGARYRPDTGQCVDGPCSGARLTALALVEQDGGLWCAGRATREELPDET